MSAPTPRPWLVPEQSDYMGLIRIETATGKVPAIVCIDGFTTEEQMANARLIVKCVNAHDALLEALKRAHAALRPFGEHAPTIDIVAAAIARAKGQP